MLVYFFITVLSLVCFHAYINYGKYGRTINKIPGPPGLPIVGNLLNLNLSNVEIWNYMHDLTMKYPFAKVWLVTFAIVGIRKPADLKILLSDKVSLAKGYTYKPFRLWLRDGLLVSSGEKWHQRRQLITPAFFPNIMKKYLEIMSELGMSFVETLKSQGDEFVQSLIPICSDITLSIAIEAIMGVKFSTMGDKAEEYKHAIDYFLESIAYRATRPYIQDWMLKYFGAGRRMLSYIKILCEFSNKVIEERREYHKQTKQQSFQNYLDDVDDTDVYGGGGKKRLAMLDLLLQAEKEGLIDKEGIEDEINLFIAAGYDTTGMTMVFLLMLLAENKDQQELARAEANRILASSGGKITMTEIRQMEYIDRCIKESLRLYPGAPNISRTVAKDMQLESGVVPAGTEVLMLLSATHRDPNHWPNPLKFDPDRFLPEEVQKRHPFSYLPFSHGPRNCIGQKFAFAVLKSVLARVLHSFYLEPVSYTKDMQFTVHVVLATTESPRIKFIKIKNND